MSNCVFSGDAVPHITVDLLHDSLLSLLFAPGWADRARLDLAMMFSYCVAVMLSIFITCASCLNDSSDSLDSMTQDEAASNWKVLVREPHNELDEGSGVPSNMRQNTSKAWHYDFMAELPWKFPLSTWDQDVGSKLFLTQNLQAVENDTHLDFRLPISDATNFIHVLEYPAPPNLAYRISINGAHGQYILTPIGSRGTQIVVYCLLAVLPVLTGSASIWIYWYVFCTIKVYKFGQSKFCTILPTTSQSKLQTHRCLPDAFLDVAQQDDFTSFDSLSTCFTHESDVTACEQRRMILFATMEYEIKDWNIKISVGGLGFMAQLMSSDLQNLDLVWVVPCFQGIDYPQDQRADPMLVTISEVDYIVQVQYHFIQNITYVLLDAPVFRAQTAAQPYPLNVGETKSAIYYSIWYVSYIVDKI